MATVTLDLEHPSNRTVLDDDGFQVDRIALVEGIAPGSNDSVVYDAINDAGIPAIGAAHPTIATIKLKSITGKAITPTKAELTLRYAQDDNDTTTASESQARISASTAIEEVNTDAAGLAMETEFTVITSVQSYSIFSQQFTAEVERPRLTFEFGYKTAVAPIGEINSYLGKTNSAVWNGYPINSILCANIEVNQEGAEYNVRYTFIYNANTWTFYGKTIEPTGNLLSSTDPDLDLATGIKEFQVYQQADFTALGFVFQGIVFSGGPGSGGGGIASNLLPQAATIAGTAAIEKTGTGALAPDAATMTGTATTTP